MSLSVGPCALVNDNASFEGGTWSNYPYVYQKKIVAVSRMTAASSSSAP